MYLVNFYDIYANVMIIFNCINKTLLKTGAVFNSIFVKKLQQYVEVYEDVQKLREYMYEDYMERLEAVLQQRRNEIRWKSEQKQRQLEEKEMKQVNYNYSTKVIATIIIKIIIATTIIIINNNKKIITKIISCNNK